MPIIELRYSELPWGNVIKRNSVMYLRHKVTHYGREFNVNMGHEDIYKALGIEGNRLPDAGHPGQLIGNVFVWVKPKIPGKAQDAARTWCRCPDCGKELTAGKLHQHLKVHRRKEG